MKFREFLAEADTTSSTEFESWITLAYNEKEFKKAKRTEEKLLSFGERAFGVDLNSKTSKSGFNNTISKWEKLNKENSPIIQSAKSIASEIKTAFFGKSSQVSFMKQTGASTASISEFWKSFGGSNATPKTDMFIETSNKKILISLKRYPDSRLMSGGGGESRATLMAAATQYDSNINLEKTITKFGNKIGKLSATKLGVNNNTFTDIAKTIKNSLKEDEVDINTETVIKRLVQLARGAGVPDVPRNPKREWIINNVASLKKDDFIKIFDIESKFQKNIPTIAFKLPNGNFAVPGLDEVLPTGKRKNIEIPSDLVSLNTTFDIEKLKNKSGKSRPDTIKKAKDEITKTLGETFNNYFAEQANLSKLNADFNKILTDNKFKINFATEAASGDIKFAGGSEIKPELSNSFAHATFIVEFDEQSGKVNINNITIRPLVPSKHMKVLADDLKIKIRVKAASSKSAQRNPIISVDKVGARGEFKSSTEIEKIQTEGNIIENIILETLDTGPAGALLEDCITSIIDHNEKILNEGILDSLKDTISKGFATGKEFFKGLFEKIKVIVNNVIKSTLKKLEDIIKNIPKTWSSFITFLKEFMGFEFEASVEGDKIDNAPSGKIDVTL